MPESSPPFPNPKSLCVFCGARFGTDPASRTTAVALGQMLANQGVTLVYGGGGVGLMGLVANAALDSGGKVIGIIPRFLLEREAGHPDLTETSVVETMHERKLQMFERSDGFVVLPGGLGFTLRHRKYYLDCVAFSPDGQSLAACGIQGTVQVWDLAGRKISHQFKTGGGGNVLVTSRGSSTGT